MKFKILCVAAVEDRENCDKQIMKQTVQPDRTIYLIDEKPAKGIEARRKRIAANQRKLQDVVKAYQHECNLVWQIEQDGDLPEDCLERLIEDYKKLHNNIGDDFGYISGIEVGRHGLYCLGAWRNIKSDSFESLNHNLEGIQEVEATGLYCLLAEPKVFTSGYPAWHDEPYGPDVVWGRSLNKRIFVDMDIRIGHITPRGTIRPEHISTTTVKFYKQPSGAWNYKEM